MMRRRCPYCRVLTEWEENPFRPFCSERCKLADLGKWASEEYRIKGKGFSEEQEEAGGNGSEDRRNGD